MFTLASFFIERIVNTENQIAAIKKKKKNYGLGNQVKLSKGALKIWIFNFLFIFSTK